MHKLSRILKFPESVSPHRKRRKGRWESSSPASSSSRRPNSLTSYTDMLLADWSFYSKGEIPTSAFLPINIVCVSLHSFNVIAGYLLQAFWIYFRRYLPTFRMLVFVGCRRSNEFFYLQYNFTWKLTTIITVFQKFNSFHTLNLKSEFFK